MPKAKTYRLKPVADSGDFDVPSIDESTPTAQAVAAIAHPTPTPSEALPTTFADALKLLTEIDNRTGVERLSRAEQRAHVLRRKEVAAIVHRLQQGAPAPVTDANTLAMHRPSLNRDAERTSRLAKLAALLR